MQIGLLGLTFRAGNKGCEALSYSFLEILNNAAVKCDEIIAVKIFTKFPIKKYIRSGFNYEKSLLEFRPVAEYSNLEIGFCFYREIKEKYYFDKELKKCDVVFDFTAGDSFTDIYGQERFYTRTRLKKAIINKGVPLILGSQTIGPFKDEKVKEMAAEVINESLEVYVRDEMSLKYTEKISGRKAKLTSDVAFALPYNLKEEEYSEKKKIGFNPSGLLWSGGYTRNNQFELKVDYREYCRKIIKILLEKYEVHLILHAYSLNMDSADNDLVAVEELHKEFPQTIVSPQFKTPMEAKSYIAQMDAFIGARMHATIGAFSAGVPVIPFSYSRKFEGLFENLEYEVGINGREDTTQNAIVQTIGYIENMDELKKHMKSGREKALQSNKFIEKEIVYLIRKNNSI